MSRKDRKDGSVTTIELDRPNRKMDAEVEGEEKDPLWRRFLSIAFTVAVIVFTIYLWPSMLGGQTRLIIVSGQSMEPTYDLRDIVVARDSGDTEIGDVVVFEVPEGGQGAGSLVIHRVLLVDDEGFFITQGDNRTTPDKWQLTEENIVGKPLAHIPKGGKMLGFIQNIWVIAGIVGVVALFMLWPDAEDDEDAEQDEDEEQLVELEPVAPDLGPAARWRAIDETDALGRDVAWFLLDEPAIIGEQVLPDVPKILVEVPAESEATSELSPDELAQQWLDNELKTDIDDDVMEDALAWLDEQLAGVEQPVAH